LASMVRVALIQSAGRRIEREESLDARDLVTRAYEIMLRPYSEASRQEAQRFYERALEIEPGAIDAGIGVALCLVTNLLDGWSASFQEDGARAELLLQRAIDHDPNHTLAHLIMGQLRRVQGRLRDSRIELERAIALNPNSAVAFRQLGMTQMYLGQPETA